MSHRSHRFRRRLRASPPSAAGHVRYLEIVQRRTGIPSPCGSYNPGLCQIIKVVTGDGAKWITECVNEFTPDCERCVDQFHVVQWAMDALDEVRREIWNEAYADVKRLKKENPRSPGRPKADDPGSTKIKAAKQKADDRRFPAMNKAY